MLFKLAFRNVRRQIGNYFIYFITVSITVALMFSLNTLIYSEVMETLKEQLIDMIEPIAMGVSFLIAVSIAFVLGYVTRFLLGRRKKEFGLYLTLGMSRYNILVIFAFETAITFLLSLGAGLLLGMGLYRVVAYLLLNFLELDYALAGYSATATLLTVIMVAAMFLVASLASLLYLRWVKIEKLLKAEQTVEKEPKTKSITVWFSIFVATCVLTAVTTVLFSDWYVSDNHYDRISELPVYILLFIVCTVLLPMSFCKGFIGFLFRFRKFTSRGTRTFTLRQLSGRLNANSVMIGVLSFFLSLTFVMSNVCYTQKNTIAEEMNRCYPYDYSECWSTDLFSMEKAEQVLDLIGSYVEIKEVHIFTAYTAAHPKDYDPEGFENGLYDSYPVPKTHYYRESDFQKFCSMLGKTAPKLNGGYLLFQPVIWNDYGKFDYDPLSTESDIVLDGKAYRCIGTLVTYSYPWETLWREQAIIVPDEAVSARELKVDENYNFVNVLFANYDFDVRALREEMHMFMYGCPQGYAMSLKYYEYLTELSGIGLVLFASLFFGAVFTLLSMATLALKTLSMLTEDKERYRTLWRLGASETMIGKSLFSQMFFFFFMPFVMPLALCFPLAPMLARASELYQWAASFVPLQLLSFAGVMLLLFGLYFIITYLLAYHDLQLSIRAKG